MPTLELVNSVVDFGHCFLKYPYEKTIELSNKSPLPGCYEVLPQVIAPQHCTVPIHGSRAPTDTVQSPHR